MEEEEVDEEGDLDEVEDGEGIEEKEDEGNMKK